MVDYFPADLCMQILLHLPVKSLIRFTAVSKSWRSLITSPSFIHAHISNAKIHTLFQHDRRNDRHQLYQLYRTCSVLDFNEKNGCLGFNSCYDLPRVCIPQLGQLGVIGSCDGLVLLTNYWRSFVVWNPSVQNHVVIPENPTVRYDSRSTAIGFGVADHVYKVVCISKNVDGDGEGDAHIYTIGTGRWRRIQGFVVTTFLVKCQTFSKGRLLHWYNNWGWILAFEIGSEVFREIMLPDLLVSKEYFIRMDLLEIEGSLGVGEYCLDNGRACNVWIMKEYGVQEYGVQESWTKLYRIDVAPCFRRVVGFRNGEALLDHFGMQLVAYNPETRKTNNLGITGTPIDDYYVESLLLLKGSLV